MSENASLEPERTEPIVGFQVKKLNDVQPANLAIRFAFGAAVSVLSAVCGVVLSPIM